MTARPIFSAYRLRGVTPRVADGTFAAGSRAAVGLNRLRGGTAGIFYTRRDSQPPALNKPGEGIGHLNRQAAGCLPRSTSATPTAGG